jgi:demethylmenaquinone methyltransferase/2-methoxy-6-polyprenyl-1,4-benzoquinol methylase/phosphoethanolamine N-methyltransferase
METHTRRQTSAGAPATRGRTIRWASHYDVLTGLLALGRERQMREMTVELAQVKLGDRVLDVGCGTGTLTLVAKRWAGPEGEVHGLDAAPKMIDVARRKAEQASVVVDFQVGLIEDIPFPDGVFDVVLSSLMLHHLPGDLKRKGFAEMWRVLKSGGRVLAVDFEAPDSRLLKALGSLFPVHGRRSGGFQALADVARAAGFTRVQTGRTRFRVLSYLGGNKLLE